MVLTQLGGKKKSNGHKQTCQCPICKNMKKSKRGGDIDENMDAVVNKAAMDVDEVTAAEADMDIAAVDEAAVAENSALEDVAAVAENSAMEEEVAAMGGKRHKRGGNIPLVPATFGGKRRRSRGTKKCKKNKKTKKCKKSKRHRTHKRR
jgi:hypothetical protein